MNSATDHGYFMPTGCSLCGSYATPCRCKPNARRDHGDMAAVRLTKAAQADRTAPEYLAGLRRRWAELDSQFEYPEISGIERGALEERERIGRLITQAEATL